MGRERERERERERKMDGREREGTVTCKILLKQDFKQLPSLYLHRIL